MKLSIAILFVLVALLAADRFLGRVDTRGGAAVLEPAAPPSSPAAVPTEQRAQDPRLAERVTELERALEVLRSELAALRRAPATASSVAEQTSDDFREKHAADVLAIVAEAAARETRHTVADRFRTFVAAFAAENELTPQAAESVLATLVEAAIRADAVLARFPRPEDRVVGAENPRAQEWRDAWSDLGAWRFSELSRVLDAPRIESLVEFLRTSALQSF